MRAVIIAAMVAASPASAGGQDKPTPVPVEQRDAYARGYVALAAGTCMDARITVFDDYLMYSVPSQDDAFIAGYKDALRDKNLDVRCSRVERALREFATSGKVSYKETFK